MCHLVRRDERHLVPRPLTQMEEGSLDEDKSSLLRDARQTAYVEGPPCRIGFEARSGGARATGVGERWRAADQ